MAAQKLAYSIQDAADQLGIGTSMLRQMIANSEIVARYIGSKPVVAHDELQAFLASRPTERTTK